MREKIWLTAHTRMVTEARHRRNAKLWDLIVIWYSTAMVIASVMSLQTTEGSETSYLLVSLSIGVLAMSIFVPTLGHKVDADKHRSCYLSLQELLDTADNGALSKEYHSILAEYPNHQDRDWISYLVTSRLGGTKLMSEKGEIEANNWHFLSFFFYCLFDLIFWIVLFFAPLLVFNFL